MIEAERDNIQESNNQRSEFLNLKINHKIRLLQKLTEICCYFVTQNQKNKILQWIHQGSTKDDHQHCKYPRAD